MHGLNIRVSDFSIKDDPQEKTASDQITTNTTNVSGDIPKKRAFG